VAVIPEVLIANTGIAGEEFEAEVGSPPNFVPKLKSSFGVFTIMVLSDIDPMLEEPPTL
jgi:hypothetical protein